VAGLRDVRLRRLLSVRALAKRAAVAPSTVHLIETGRRAPQLLTIYRLSQALGVDPAEIDEFRAALDDATVGRPQRQRGDDA
jgi:transcriptional regulator with XRE-family HTH domain